jgi:2'-5' RNA ligase/GNAT superfamily N-acetyltransferase
MEIEYRLNPPVANAELDRLYAASWPNHRSPRDFSPELVHLLAIVGAYADGELVGSVKLAWDGAVHAFLLDPTVHPKVRHHGIGRTLVAYAVDVARARGLVWLHVDYEPQLDHFYRACGFKPTAAGLIRLDRTAGDKPDQTNAPRRVIVFFPSIDDLQPIVPFRQRWDPLANYVAPHLTLVFPFTDPLAPADLRRHVSDAIGGIEPFAIRLSGLSGSEGEYVFVTLKQGNDQIVALHDRLYTGPLRRHLSRAYTYVPHITVGRITDRRQFDTALAEAAVLSVDIETRVRTITIYVVEPDGSRRVEDQVALHG